MRAGTVAQMERTPIRHARHEAATHAADAVDFLGDQIATVVAEVKPRLRGWLHAVTSPLTIAAGVVLIVLSPTSASRVGSAVFMGSAVLLFSVSAIYHRGSWSPRVWAALQRFDHANIFLLIAGSYTPFTLLLLEGSTRTIMLSVVWGGAALGVALRLFWRKAPRWAFVPIYLALGWAAIFVAPQFASAASTAVIALIAAGGLLYTLGGIVYGFRKPDPFPSWFGFHEVFHTLTIAAFGAHYVGVSLATYSLR